MRNASPGPRNTITPFAGSRVFARDDNLVGRVKQGGHDKSSTHVGSDYRLEPTYGETLFRELMRLPVDEVIIGQKLVYLRCSAVLPPILVDHSIKSDILQVASEHEM